MAVISYAQNGEDLRLRRLFPYREPGFYLDVGAADPVIHSVTKHFYEHGWHGINIEPTRGYFAALAEDRTRDRNLNVALSDRPGTLDLYEVVKRPDLTTASPAQAEVHQNSGFEVVRTAVPATTLAEVCETFGVGQIDFLSIDVEGHESQVIAGGNWQRWRPRAVVIEAVQPATQIPAHAQWEHLLFAADYVFATFDGMNRYYVRAEDRQLIPLLAPPINLFDAYIPYRLHRQVEDAQAAAASATAAREAADLRNDSLEQSLATIRGQRDSAREELGATRRALETTARKLAQAVQELEAAEIQLRPLLALGSRSLRVAFWLQRLARSHPRVAGLIKRVV